MVLIIDYGRERCHFNFKDNCEPKANNLGKNLILFVAVLFIGEEWLSLFTLQNTGLARQFRLEILLKIGENTS